MAALPEYRVVTNLDRAPDVLVVGTAGAQDLLLYEYTPARARRYERFFGAPPHVLQGDDGARFIRLPRRWGGAAHYVAQALAAAETPFEIALWSTVGDDAAALARLTRALQAVCVPYALLVFAGVRRPLFPGVVFDSGERYYTRRHLVLGAVDHLRPEYLTDELNHADLTVLCSQPMAPLLGFLERVPHRAAVQLWEYDLPDLLADEPLRARIWAQLAQKCALLNLNEVELWLLGRIYYAEDALQAADPLERAARTDALVDRLAGDLPRTLLLVSFGPLGALLAGHTHGAYHRLALPSLLEAGAFGGGGGDTAWAGALRALLRLAAQRGLSAAGLPALFESMAGAEFSQVLRAFVLGGVQASFTPDLLDREYSRRPAYLAEVAGWATAVGQLPVLGGARDLVQRQMERSDAQFVWASHAGAVEKRLHPALEDLLWRAYGARLAPEPPAAHGGTEGGRRGEALA